MCYYRLHNTRHIAEINEHTYYTNFNPLIKDIGYLAEGGDGDDDSLRLDVVQVGLRQHPHSLAASVLGEDEGVAAQAHGARLEAVPVHADGLLTGLT